MYTNTHRFIPLYIKFNTKNKNFLLKLANYANVCLYIAFRLSRIEIERYIYSSYKGTYKMLHYKLK